MTELKRRLAVAAMHTYKPGMDLPAPDSPSPDYRDARINMVNGQVRPNKVYDPRIIEAMRTLPRERFVPPNLAAVAYVDEDVPLGRGRVLMEPLVIARLIETARVLNGERVLVVGAGTGYGAAVLASCGAQVTALEDDESLLAIARGVLPDVSATVDLVAGPVKEGRPGPWALVLIEGAVRAVPESFATLVQPDGGRLVTVLAPAGGMGHGVLVEHAGSGHLRARPEFDCATPLLPQFEPAPAFDF